MKINPINTYNPTFEIYQGTTKTVRDYGTVICDTGLYKGNKIDIYSCIGKQGKLEHKLFYVSKLMNWLKSKLVYYSGGKKWKEIRSERHTLSNWVG